VERSALVARLRHVLNTWQLDPESERTIRDTIEELESTNDHTDAIEQSVARLLLWLLWKMMGS
jgi:hypothetical protein